MTADEALLVVNGALGIEARVTVKGDELKCEFPDEDGGTRKGYLGAWECSELEVAFGVLAKALRGDGSPKEGA